MAITLRLKRRASGGAVGAPAALLSAEPAFNEADKVLYYGFGDDGSGNATSVIPIGGEGAFLTLATVQTVTGNKTFTGTVTVPTPTAAGHAATKAYVDGLIAANDAMVFKGVINASANPNYPAADAGHTYRISVAGKIGGASGPNVEVGDMLLCTVDATAAGTHATVGANWAIIQTNIDGALTTANIGSTVQAYDATLQNLAGLATAANQGLYLTGTDTFATFSLTAGGRALGGVAGTANTFPYFSAANTVTLGSITAAGRAVLAAADATAQRTALGLGTMATQNANAVAITGGTIDGVVLDGGVY